jgi:hypothetical protein
MRRVGSVEPAAGMIITLLAWRRVIVRCRCDMRSADQDMQL